MLDIKANLNVFRSWIINGSVTTEQFIQALDDLIDSLDHPDFTNSFVDPDDYVRVGDIMDCLSELSYSEDQLICIEGLFEWAMGKRACKKDELLEYWLRDFEEREILDD